MTRCASLFLVLCSLWDCAAPSVAQAEMAIAAWNLEHFGEGKTRGFPENTRGGPSYPPRTDADLERIAQLILELNFRILALSEIDAKPRIEDGVTRYRSVLLDRLVEKLGPAFQYVAGSAGSGQHLALLYDETHVRINDACEFTFEEERVNGKNLFDRQPLFAHFTALKHGQPRNDFVVVAVHLASGQDKVKNHDRAIELLVEELSKARDAGLCIPGDEYDVIILGDFNASRFDNRREFLWDFLEEGEWDVLADHSSYPATRLSGHPLALRESKIDYIVVSKGAGGLQGEEVSMDTAIVHIEVIGEDPEAFRAFASDHIPVSVTVAITDDTDRAR